MRAARALPISLLTLLLPLAPLTGQGRPVRFSPDSATTAADVEATTVRRIGALELNGLPADDVDAILPLRPGITPAPDGLSFRGSRPNDFTRSLNGVDISAGSRRVLLSPAPRGLGSVAAVTGPLPATIGGSRSGALLLESRVPAFGRHSGFSYESDRLLGASLGLNRLEGELSGASRRSRVLITAALTGQKAAEAGADARDLPIYLPAGIDTSVAVPASFGEITSDTTLVPIYNFGVGRGECDSFTENHGLQCAGNRTPGTALTTYRFLASADHEIGRASRLMITTYRGRDSRRLFSYPDLFNRSGLFGREDASSAHSLVVSGALDARRGSGYRLGLSRQSDELVIGPLTAEGEASSWDPAGGFMLGGLDFRWDLESFPVDSPLVANYRENRPGSRRSPYVLEESSRYVTTDIYRDGPYGLPGFVERGGPVGRLTLFREKRTAGFASGSWTVSQNAVFTAGGEYVRYDIASYEHALTSQVGSDVYRVRPIRGALFAEDRIAYGPLTVIAGVRYAFFSSRAERPEALDTLRLLPGGAPNPAFGAYTPFPRITSYTDQDGTYTIDGQPLPLVRTARDRRHSVWTPHLRTAVAIGESSTLRGSLARHARMPDLQLLYRGMNTDLAITSVDAVFGSDLGFERATAWEFGFNHRLGSVTSIDLSGFRTSATRLPVLTLSSERDPTRSAMVDLRRIAGSGRERVAGVELAVEHRGEPLTAAIGYAFVRARTDDEIAAWERPHTFTAVLGYTAPTTVRRGLFRGASLWLSLRGSSGLPYAPCAGQTLSDEPCAGATARSERLPAFRQLDARFARRIGGQRGNAVFYVDARNVLNRRNVLRVFSETGTTSNAAAHELAATVAHADLAAEANANGALLSDGSVDLAFGGVGTAGCVGWRLPGGAPAAPNCIALIRAEQRYGNGDSIYSTIEQAEAATARFDALRGTFLDAPRRIRIGVEIGL